MVLKSLLSRVFASAADTGAADGPEHVYRDTAFEWARSKSAYRPGRSLTSPPVVRLHALQYLSVVRTVLAQHKLGAKVLGRFGTGLSLVVLCCDGEGSVVEDGW